MRTPLLAGMLLVAACGGADEDVSDAPSTTTTVGPATSASTPTSPDGPLTPSAGLGRSTPAPAAPVAALVAGFNDAGFDLLRTQPVAQNLVFSPSSIGHALLMARGAADPATGAAIDAAFALPDGIPAHQAWNAIDQQLAADQNPQVTITVADRIWPHLDVEPDQAWIDLLAAEHGADVQPLDFTGDPDASTAEINKWVGDRTEGLIPELLEPGFLKPETVLVLTDTVYFAADWDRPFGKYDPVDGTFTTLDGTAVPTSFMQELELADRRGAGDGFVGAELPYVGGDVSMLVIVPDVGRFEELRGRLGQPLLDEIDATFTTGPYELLLPTWEDNSSINLLPWLKEIGAAPGSYPAITPDAFLGAAVHGADIAVDEFGTVAAAATALAFDVSGPPSPELTVAADRPFLYLIRHRPTGLVLFAGQVTTPG